LPLSTENTIIATAFLTSKPSHSSTLDSRFYCSSFFQTYYRHLPTLLNWKPPTVDQTSLHLVLNRKPLTDTLLHHSLSLLSRRPLNDQTRLFSPSPPPQLEEVTDRHIIKPLVSFSRKPRTDTFLLSYHYYSLSVLFSSPKQPNQTYFLSISSSSFSSQACSAKPVDHPRSSTHLRQCILPAVELDALLFPPVYCKLFSLKNAVLAALPIRSCCCIGICEGNGGRAAKSVIYFNQFSLPLNSAGDCHTWVLKKATKKSQKQQRGARCSRE
jgi:hypothetical protein